MWNRDAFLKIITDLNVKALVGAFNQRRPGLHCDCEIFENLRLKL